MVVPVALLLPAFLTKNNNYFYNHSFFQHFLISSHATLWYLIFLWISIRYNMDLSVKLYNKKYFTILLNRLYCNAPVRA